MRADLVNLLGDVLEFNGNVGITRTGTFRIEEVTPNEHLISIALPPPEDPRMFLLSGILISTLRVLVPAFPAEDVMQPLAVLFAHPEQPPIALEFEDGSLTVTHNHDADVFEIHVHSGEHIP